MVMDTNTYDVEVQGFESLATKEDFKVLVLNGTIVTIMVPYVNKVNQVIFKGPPPRGLVIPILLTNMDYEKDLMSIVAIHSGFYKYEGGFKFYEYEANTINIDMT